NARMLALGPDQVTHVPVRSHIRSRFGVATLVGVAALVAMWPTHHGEFLAGDDQSLILEHYFVNHPSWTHAGDLLASTHGDLYQPLPMLSFQANYAIAHTSEGGSISPYGFHLTNIALHAVNAILATLLATRLAGCLRVGAITGLLFPCHPFAFEAVAWINGR